MSVVCALLLGWHAGAAGAAEPGELRAAQLQKEAGAAALQAGDLAKAARAFTASYRLRPLPEILYYLGKVALAQGQSVEAQDLLRRYQVEAERGTADELLADAQRVTDTQVGADDSGEVYVTGPPAALVRDGDRILGMLPLLIPLLLRSGKHRIVIERGSEQLGVQVDVEAGRNVEVRFNLDSRAVLVSLPPPIVLLTESGSPASPIPPPLLLGLEQAIRRARYTVISRKAALVRAPNAASCLGPFPLTVGCAGELVSKNEAEALLRACITSSFSQGRPGWSFELVLIDAVVLATAASENLSCPSCTVEQAAERLTAAAVALLARGLLRAHGTLAITSIPPGAELWESGVRLGTTPYQRPAFSGTHRLDLRLARHVSQELLLTVDKNQSARAQAALEPFPSDLLTPPPPATARTRRSRWPIWSGVGLLGAGAILSGFGISGLAAAGSCSQDTPGGAMYCRQFYDTQTAGSVLLGVGLGLSLGGAIALTAGALR